MTARIFTDGSQPSLFYKVFAADVSGTGERTAFLVVAPAYAAVQVDGPDNPLNPVERIFIDWGFQPLADLDNKIPGPTPSWTVTELPGGRIWCRYEGEDFYESSQPAPEEWHQAARRDESVCVLLIREPTVSEITGQQFTDAWLNNNGFLLTAKYKC